MVPLLLADGSSWLHRIWFRSEGASTQAVDTDNIYMFIMWVCIISFGLLLIPIVWFPIKYRRAKQATNYMQSPSHNTPLELTWSIVPLLVMTVMFIWGFKGYVAKLAAPSDAEEITIRGQKWSWTPVYRNGAGTDQTTRLTDTKYDVPVIYVPAGRPVKLIMVSTDVIHAFYIPDFRTKMDVFPNRYTSMWFQPMEPTVQSGDDAVVDKVTGKALKGHKVFCAEYCGTNHSEMAGLIVVLPEAAYEKKVHELATKFPDGSWAKAGAEIAKRKGCFACHSVDGAKNTGPTWQNMYGDTHSYTDGSTHKVDEDWLRENIAYSQKRVVSGFANSMPVFAGQINDNEMFAIIAYIKTLSTTTPKPELDKANEVPEFTKKGAK